MSNSSFQVFNIESLWLFAGETRLNASSYFIDFIKASNLIEKLEKYGFTTDNLDRFSSDILVGARSKRLYTTKKQGIPYLMPIDLFALNLKSRKWVRRETKDLENWWISPYTILITQSGTPGRTLIANKLFEGKVVSPNVIRYVPNEVGKEKIGYIYAYLSSWMGQAFLLKDLYGATVKHIEPYHIASIPIPRIPPKLEEEINQKICEAHRLREEAQELVLKAEEALYSELDLPEIVEDDIEFFGEENGRIVKSFSMKADELNLRLDASYHIPLFHSVIQKLTKAKSGTTKSLGNIAETFVPPRFKRIYVNDPSEGIPMLQGTHIPQVKPQDIKYIWKKMKNLKSYIVRKNWILTTCSGTIGRLSLIRDFWDGWTATNHLLRIIPDENEIHPGYLTAFLLSIFGKVQFERLSYGGVVDEIGEAGELFNNILILKPQNEDKEKLIGNLIFEAYDKRDKANQIEDKTIKLLEETLEESALQGVRP